MVASFMILFSQIAAIGAEDPFVEKLKKANKKDFDMTNTEFRIRIQGMPEILAGIIEKSGDRIIALATDPIVKKNALMWKMSAIPQMYNTFNYSKPLVAGLDSWAFCLQMKTYFKSEEGQKTFKEWNVLGLEATEQMELKIVALAKLVSPTGDISQVENFINSWVDDNPIQIPIFVRESILPALATGVGEEVLGTLQTVSELSSQLDDITKRITLYGNHLPKQARWQAELLLSELGTHEKIEIILTELGIIAEGLQQVGTVIEKSPEIITNERTAILEAFREERLETLDFLSSERIVLIDALQSERKIILQDVIEGFDKSIDHFFLRAAQLAGVCLIMFFSVGFIVLYWIFKYSRFLKK